jgi:hypothetical protein
MAQASIRGACGFVLARYPLQDAGITRGGQVVYFVPITIESGPTKCSIRVSRNPACFIHCEQSAPV